MVGTQEEQLERVKPLLLRSDTDIKITEILECKFIRAAEDGHV